VRIKLWFVFWLLHSLQGKHDLPPEELDTFFYRCRCGLLMKRKEEGRL
jgi:hypothetical protein